MVHSHYLCLLIQTTRALGANNSIKGTVAWHFRSLVFSWIHSTYLLHTLKYFWKYFCFRGDIHESLIFSKQLPSNNTPKLYNLRVFYPVFTQKFLNIRVTILGNWKCPGIVTRKLKIVKFPGIVNPKLTISE